MTDTGEGTRLKGALTFVFDDPRWVQKLLIGAGLVFLWFVPFLPYIILLGYMARLIKGMILEDKDPFLPEWTDFNQLFKDGLQLMVVYLIYSLPIFLVMGLGYAGFMLPVVFAEALNLAEGLGTTMIIIGYLGGIGLIGIGFLLGIAGGLIIPVMICRVAVEQRVGAAFDLQEAWQVLKANWSGFLLAYLVVIGGSMMAYYGSQLLIITIVFCCLYPFVISLVSSYLSVVSSALFADAYREGVRTLAGEQEA